MTGFRPARSDSLRLEFPREARWPHPGAWRARGRQPARRGVAVSSAGYTCHGGLCRTPFGSPTSGGRSCPWRPGRQFVGRCNIEAVRGAHAGGRQQGHPPHETHQTFTPRVCFFSVSQQQEAFFRLAHNFRTDREKRHGEINAKSAWTEKKTRAEEDLRGSKKLITRRRPSPDRRSRFIWLTPKNKTELGAIYFPATTKPSYWCGGEKLRQAWSSAGWHGLLTGLEMAETKSWSHHKSPRERPICPIEWLTATTAAFFIFADIFFSLCSRVALPLVSTAARPLLHFCHTRRALRSAGWGV